MSKYEAKVVNPRNGDWVSRGTYDSVYKAQYAFGATAFDPEWEREEIDGKLRAHAHSARGTLLVVDEICE